ncbi:hypothetical protein [Clostridium gasigenes]|uniref:Uncharacterized protein n=1 Tax=Clostridium gasigenes TaxID=94869 RepID=A0A1H0QM38_9CLOT|nr:hypothetical protein [Clostridium gasigenes]SDP17799.1 hypothetical protein SAMN04488529_102404 [Clostridium gasigenes]
MAFLFSWLLVIKMVDKYDPSRYVIYISIDKDTTLRSLDCFLRDVWMECCNHLSLSINL